MTCSSSGRVACSPSIRDDCVGKNPIMLADRAPAEVGQLRRQLDGHRLGAAGPPAMGREQPCFHLVMMGNRRVNLF
jgi:hypothetical protein